MILEREPHEPHERGELIKWHRFLLFKFYFTAKKTKEKNGGGGGLEWATINILHTANTLKINK